MKGTLLLAVLLPLVVLADWTATYSDITSTAFATAPGGLATGGLAWGDYNKDGTKDLLVSGRNGATCSLALYNNTGTQLTAADSAKTGLPNNVAATTVQWADYNNDNFLDLLIYGADCSSNGIGNLYKNKGDGSFVAVASVAFTASGSGYASFVDFNGDLMLDVVSIDATSKFFKNNGDGTFTDVSSTWATGITAPTAGAIAFSDYDRDGYADLFLVGSVSGSPAAKVFKNTGSGFTDKTSAVFPGGWTGAINAQLAFADFNLDSYQDFFTIGSGAGKLFVNNKNGTFSDATSYITSGPSTDNGTIAWGDYNGDLYPDLYVQGTGPIAQLFRNARGTSFASVTTEAFPSSILPGMTGGAAAFGDFDGDGLADDLVVIGTATTPTIHLYNSSALPMRVPERINFNAAVSGSGTSRTVTVTAYLRPPARQPITSIEIVVSPNGGKTTKVVPSFNSKDEYKFTGQVANIPVLSTVRKVWVRGVNRIGKGPWTTAQVTI